jgi:hypothetical protein
MRRGAQPSGPRDPASRTVQPSSGRLALARHLEHRPSHAYIYTLRASRTNSLSSATRQNGSGYVCRCRSMASRNSTTARQCLLSWRRIIRDSAHARVIRCEQHNDTGTDLTLAVGPELDLDPPSTDRYDGDILEATNAHLKTKGQRPATLGPGVARRPHWLR